MIWLSPRRLDWALRTRGTDLSAWPAQERAAALRLMRYCPLARMVMADALAQDDAPLDDATLADPACLARMQGGLRTRLLTRPPATPAIRWGALAACALAGLYLGTALDVGAASGALATDLLAGVQAVAFDSAL